MSPIIDHPSLHAVLEGTEDISAEGLKVSHFRGIPYGKIPGRFVQAELVDEWQGKKLDCTRFGPQCPQNPIDIGYLLRIPHSLEKDEETVAQDEFNCLNINVSVPEGAKGPLPVLIWIYGGSQVVSFPPIPHKASNTTPLVAQSISGGKPMIIVTFNYRLNIFSFGDGSERNLALKDQRLAIQWVVKHIAGFGGDKDNITLGGESAGGVYAHAHLSTGAPVRRGILMSGSLYLSPPQPYERGDGLIATLSQKLQETHNVSLKEAPVPVLLKLLADSNINTLWIQQEPDIAGWETRLTAVDELLIGDCEYESVIWRNGVETASAEEIDAAFDIGAPFGPQLKHLYSISPTRSTPSRHGALDFINDLVYAMPVEDVVRTRRQAGKTTYQYVIDQPNPWQASSRAHHAVDLLYLFAGYDLSFNPAAAKVAREMRDKWIQFINGEKPWDAGERFGFGPHGRVGVIDDAEFESRRRVKHFEVLRQVDRASLFTIFRKLAAGRISLHN